MTTWHADCVPAEVSWPVVGMNYEQANNAWEAALAHVSQLCGLHSCRAPGGWTLWPLFSLTLLAAKTQTVWTSVNPCWNNVFWSLFLPGFSLLIQRTGSISRQSVITAGGPTVASATGCCPKQKQAAGRSLPRPAAPRGRTLPASTLCPKWKWCLISWLTVRSTLQ